MSEMQTLLQKARQLLPDQSIWVNPDCGLKTRAWPETMAALEHMVQAAKLLRASCAESEDEAHQHCC